MSAKDYLELPECITVDHPVELDKPARKAYDKLERDMLLQIDSDVVDAGTAAVLTNKLLQMCNGAVYTDAGTAAHIHDCKMEAFLETIERLNGEHALVFYAYQHDRDRLQQALEKVGLRVRVLSSPTDQEAWNDGQIDVLLAHPASCAYGLNLQQGGRHIVWYGHTWSLELYQQANARLYRQGQDKPVMIHRMIVRDGMDEAVTKALAGKSSTQDSLLEALKARIEHVRDSGVHL